MKDRVVDLVHDDIKDLNIFIDDVLITHEDGKNVFNIVLDSSEVIDLNKVTDASRIINKILDESKILDEVDADEVDIYSKEKGEE